MNVTEINERLRYWTEPHPDWKPNPEWPEDVGCVLYEGPDALVLIDPLIRDDLDGPPVLCGGNRAIAAALRAFGDG